MNDHSPLRSAWTESLERGQTPDAGALRAHLRAVHRDHAGFTETCARACRDQPGAPVMTGWPRRCPVRGARVLDLACGSGPLLDILHDRAAGLRLIGVDMCPEELALARARLPEGGRGCCRPRRRTWPEIPDGSLDAVLCHWALTLMDPVTPVLDEVRRVLAPVGRFAALVDGPMEAAPGYAGCMT